MSNNTSLPDFNGYNILVVEDNAINFMVLEQQLKNLGCAVSWGDTGEKGFELFTLNTFDCVFMDCMLPSMSGLECTQLIRQFEQNQAKTRTPIIALTADVRDSNREACFEAGMDDFMGKPFKFIELSNVLDLWLNKQDA